MYDLRRSERFERGTGDFPIEYYLCVTSDANFNLPVHWHVEYEIIHVLRGIFPFTLDGKEIEIKPNSVCVIRDGVLHGENKKEGKSCIFESLVFKIDFLRARGFGQDTFLHNMVHHQIAVKSLIPDSEVEIYSAALSAFRAMKNKAEGYQLITAGALQQFFGYIQSKQLFYKDTEVQSQSRRRTEQLKSVMELIETKYSASITLEDMANAAGMSPKYFCAVFKSMTGHTPVEYLNIYRIDQASYLLRTGSEELINIAYSCGFKDFSYFIRMFKKLKGTTPLKYRNHKESFSQDNLLPVNSGVQGQNQ